MVVFSGIVGKMFSKSFSQSRKSAAISLRMFLASPLMEYFQCFPLI